MNFDILGSSTTHLLRNHRTCRSPTMFPARPVLLLVCHLLNRSQGKMNKKHILLKLTSNQHDENIRTLWALYDRLPAEVNEKPNCRRGVNKTTSTFSPTHNKKQVVGHTRVYWLTLNHVILRLSMQILAER